MSNERSLWMGDIQPHWDENFLLSLFQDQPGIQNVKMIRNQTSGLPSGFAFIEFETKKDADRALRMLNNNPIGKTGHIFRLNSRASGNKYEGKDLSLFVGDIGSDVTDVMLHQAFTTRYKSITSAKVIMDPLLRSSKGYGFVRFADPVEAERALIEMNGVIVGSKAIRVNSAVSRKLAILGATSEVATQQVASRLVQDSQQSTLLYVGGLPDSITKEEIEAKFKEHGPIVKVTMAKERGSVFVQYSHRAAALNAIRLLNETEIKGNTIKVSWGFRDSNLNSLNIKIDPLELKRKYPFKDQVLQQKGIEHGLVRMMRHKNVDFDLPVFHQQAFKTPYSDLPGDDRKLSDLIQYHIKNDLFKKLNVQKMNGSFIKEDYIDPFYIEIMGHEDDINFSYLRSG